MKNQAHTWRQSHLADQQLHQLLEKADADLAEEARAEGCCYCGGKLHRADYERKARGVPEWNKRYSFCCDEDDCRRRRTPESLRFLGRRVYAGLIVVLVSAMTHGLKPERVRRIRETPSVIAVPLKTPSAVLGFTPSCSQPIASLRVGLPSGSVRVQITR
jgi:hypothetical protein